MADSRREGTAVRRDGVEPGGGGAWVAWALALGAVRFARLGDWSLWYDEAITWADSHHALASPGLHNPAGYWLIRRTVELTGGVPSELFLRLLPALVGWLCLPLAWWSLRPAIGGRAAGLAALLLAASPWHVYWSQNARFYTMAQALALVGAGLVLRGCVGRRPPRSGASAREAASARGRWIVLASAGALVAGAGLLFQPTAALVLAGLVLAPWVAELAGASLGRQARGAAVALASLALLGGAVASPWLLEIWRTYQANKGAGAGLGAALASAAHFALTTGFYVTPLTGAAFLIGAVVAVRARDGGAVWVGAVALVGVAVAALASMQARVSAQYVFVLLPWIAGLAAWPVARLDARGARVAYAALLVLPALVATVLYASVRHGERPRWREAYELVWELRRPGDLVLGMQAPIGEYYLAPTRTDLRDPRAVAWLDRHRADESWRWAGRGRRTWVVLRPEDLEDWRSADRRVLEGRLTRDGRLVRRWPLAVEGRDLSVEVWVVD